MAKPSRRLGRGLDSLVTDLVAQAADRPQAVRGIDRAQKIGPSIEAAMVRIDALRPSPFQPRSDPAESIEELARSIKQSGMLQPISVRPHGEGYEIIAGERRWRAARSLGMANVPVIVRAASDDQMLELALIENIQREDLNALDRAKAYDRYRRQFGLSTEDVAERVGEDRSTVSNYLRILDLDDDLQQMLAKGVISMGHARCLLGIGDSRRRTQLAQEVAVSGLSVRALEQIVRTWKQRPGFDSPAEQRPSGEKSFSPHIEDMQRRFEEVLKTKVTIREGKRKGKGRITIHFYSLDDFDRIAEAVGVRLD